MNNAHGFHYSHCRSRLDGWGSLNSLQLTGVRTCFRVTWHAVHGPSTVPSCALNRPETINKWPPRHLCITSKRVIYWQSHYKHGIWTSCAPTSQKFCLGQFPKNGTMRNSIECLLKSNTDGIYCFSIPARLLHCHSTTLEGLAQFCLDKSILAATRSFVLF